MGRKVGKWERGKEGKWESGKVGKEGQGSRLSLTSPEYQRFSDWQDPPCPLPRFPHLPDMLEQPGEYPLGHAPDNGIFQLIRRNHSGLTSNFETDGVVSPRPQEIVQGHPPGGGDLLIEHQRWGARQQKHEWPYGYWREDRSPGNYVLERTSKSLEWKGDTHFFMALPQDSGQQILIPGLATPAW
jgi:hypothetical protein